MFVWQLTEANMGPCVAFGGTVPRVTSLQKIRLPKPSNLGERGEQTFPDVLQVSMIQLGVLLVWLANALCFEILSNHI